MSPPRDTASRNAACYGVLHALVDASCVTSVYLAIPSHRLPLEAAFTLVMGYDVLAFGSQAFFGLLADRWRASKDAFLAGLVLTTLGVVALEASPWLTLVLAGVGNALFHLGAGALVLQQAPCRATPAGLFVAPGALGLGAGIYFGRDGGLEAPWWLLPFLILGLIWAIRHRKSTAGAEETTPLGFSLELGSLAAVLLLMASIAVRSFVGLGGCHECPKSLAIRVGLPLVACLGKGLGGVVADRLGWLETAVGALMLSAPLIVLGSTTPAVMLPGMLFFQMTMPVTLVALSVALPGRPAFAFGLGCLALILGALPTFYSWGKAFYGPTTFLACILLSALAVWRALVLLKIARSRPSYVPEVGIEARPCMKKETQ